MYNRAKYTWICRNKSNKRFVSMCHIQLERFQDQVIDVSHCDAFTLSWQNLGNNSNKKIYGL